MRKLIILLAIPSACHAGLLGPDTYDDCILQGMKGVGTETAARETREACRRKFPTQAPSVQLPAAAPKAQAVTQIPKGTLNLDKIFQGDFSEIAGGGAAKVNPRKEAPQPKRPSSRVPGVEI